MPRNTTQEEFQSYLNDIDSIRHYLDSNDYQMARASLDDLQTYVEFAVEKASDSSIVWPTNNYQQPAKKKKRINVFLWIVFAWAVGIILYNNYTVVVTFLQEEGVIRTSDKEFLKIEDFEPLAEDKKTKTVTTYDEHGNVISTETETIH